jgi:hypothetical protein
MEFVQTFALDLEDLHHLDCCLHRLVMTPPSSLHVMVCYSLPHTAQYLQPTYQLQQ